MNESTTRSDRTSVRCNLCGADDKDVWIEVDGFPIVRCRGCGLHYVTPRLSHEAIVNIYTKEYFSGDGKNPYYANYLSMRPWRVEECRKEVRRIMRFVPSGDLLDVGCAFGFFLEAAKELGWRAKGVEISEHAANYARSERGLDVATGIFTELGLPSGSCDVLHMDGVIEHTEDPLANLQEAARVIRPGGLLVMGTPNIGSFCARVYRHGFRLVEPRAHLYYFSPSTVSRMLRRAGFTVLRIRYPYFNSPYCNRKELWNLARTLVELKIARPLLRRMGRDGVALPIIKSPPFYGNRMMVYARRDGPAAS